ncbi:MAG: biotin/lipoyl-containing protein [Methanobrevibacter sp.]|nr:biotin/lipoyl-containing protein [Methanobrevibacter sp.]
MKDLSIDIIKDNNYFVKSPCDGEIIRFFVDKGDEVLKNQLMAVLKSENSYIEIEAEFPGRVTDVCRQIDEPIKKWDDIAVVDVTSKNHLDGIPVSVHSPDYTVIYTFQQEILPKLIYSETEKFIEGIGHEQGKFIYFLLKEVYTNNHMTIPFKPEDFEVVREIFGEDIIVLTIRWPNLQAPLLTVRSYILIHPQSRKIQYFTCEKSLNDEFMISSIIPSRDGLTRYNYGVAPDSLQAEKRKAIKIFISY